MQEEDIPDQGLVLEGGAQVTIPAKVVDWLRRAAYAEIASAAQAIDVAAFAKDREAHPERFRGPAQSLRETYALLDAIGWSGTVPPADVQVDLGRDCWALMRALEAALEFADEDVSEPPHNAVGHPERRQAPQRDAQAERIGVLWDFTAAAQARIDALAVQEGAGVVLGIAA
jgi:hypothetical protein